MRPNATHGPADPAPRRCPPVDSHGFGAKTKYAPTGLDTDESAHRIELLHKNLQKYGTIYNTLAETTELVGTIRRKV